VFCIDCGQALVADARFCTKCGAKIGAEAAAAAAAGAAAGTAPPTAAAPKGFSQRLSPPMIMGGLALGLVGIWLAARTSSGPQAHPPSADATAQPAVERTAATEQPAASSPAPTRSVYSLSRGSPMCGSFKGAITAIAVMRSGNPTAIAMVLDRQGCEQAPQTYQFDVSNTLMQELQAGVVLLTLADGTQIYTTQDSVSMRSE